MTTNKRDSWTNNFGFVMAAAGAAIGLGNIWRFPYTCGENGGGAFILAYMGCVVLVGMPVLVAELLIGRNAKVGSGGAFACVVKKHKALWHGVGTLAVLIALLITSYYTIIAGWTLEYLFQSLAGALSNFGAAESQTYFSEFMTSDSRQIFWHVVFTVITVLILLGGVSGGIEKVSEILMPILLFLLVGLAIFGLKTEADLSASGNIFASKSFEFLFKPDWENFTNESFFYALGQAAFSLSIAVGTMVAYGSYLNKKENLAALGGIVVIMDTTVALLGGLVVFPIVFAFGLNPSEGTGLIFVTLPTLFAQIPAGSVIAPIFYLLLFFAALTSSISLLEPVVTHMVDEMKKSRFLACLLAGLASAVMGLIWVLTNSLENSSLFLNVDKLVSNILVPLEAIAISVFVGWFVEKRITRRELRHIPDFLYNSWKFICKWLCPIAIAIVMIRGIGT